MNQKSYNTPLNIPKGYFDGITVPSFNDYQRYLYHDFLRYLFYMCIQKADGEYPLTETEVILKKAFPDQPGNAHPGGEIRKVLIGEAPPVLKDVFQNEYFYNPAGPWPSRSPWINGPKRAMFGNRSFKSKIEFLEACAKEGFLLLDLFPYAIKYSNRTKRPYEDACYSAFGCTNPYPDNIMDTLNRLLSFINTQLSFAFGLKSFGEILLSNHNCANNLDNWLNINNIILNPPGSAALLRHGVIGNGISKYLRVVHKNGPQGPVANLLNLAGF